MKLKSLIKNLKIKEICGKTDLEISEIKTDSNCVTKGSLFVCINGKEADGHKFIRQAELYGAVAVVCERKLDSALTQIIVEDSRTAMALLAKEYYCHADKGMKIVGVIGTNGKTTTSYLIYKILKNAGVECGLIGTIGTFYGEKFIEPNLTTPDPLELHRILREMKDFGVKVIVMEVSAHAIYLNKVAGLNFEVAVFTNFSQDHLDFFGNMENYKSAKLDVFKNNKIKYIVTNNDDAVGRYLSETYKNCVTYGLDNPSDTFAIEIKEKKDYYSFVINLFDCIYDVNLYFKGLYNIYNAMAAVTTTSLLGVQVEESVSGLSKVKGVDGRMECVFSGDFSVYVDYAHTPDGLEKSLNALSSHSDRLICVFGCGGNRDVDKRYKMGVISGKLADFTVITSDNPRFEEPMAIIRGIEEGILTVTKKYVLIQDRVEGIRYAVQMAKPGDVILVAGKGCEKYQEVLGIKSPYNDKDTIEEILRG